MKVEADDWNGHAKKQEVGELIDMTEIQTNREENNGGLFNTRGFMELKTEDRK